MLKKIRHFLIEVASRIFMNLVKLILGASIGMAYVSVQYGKDLIVLKTTPEYQVAVFALTTLALIISVIETFIDWEYSQTAKQAEINEENADANQKAAQSETAAQNQA